MSVHSSSGSSSPTYSKAKLPFALPSLLTTLPRRYRRRLRSKLHARQSPASALSSIETSLDPFLTIHRLQKRKWSVYDLQNVFLVSLLVFSLVITPQPPVILKAAAVVLAVLAALVPLTSQFLIPALPVLTWVFFFFACR